MKILLDECLPAALRLVIAANGHDCETVRRAGFGSKKNGELLTLAANRWDVLLTSDRNIKHQQNMAGRKIAVLVLRTKRTRMKDVMQLLPACLEALRTIQPGTLAEVGEE